MFKRLVLFLLLCAALAAGGYVHLYGVPEPLQPFLNQVAQPSPATPAGSTPPPPEVGVIETRPVEAPLPAEYAGRIAAFRNVEVRPRVSGLLLRREYEEGAAVKKDQVLFQIDPATYEVALSRAEAQHQQALATLRQAEENFRRTEELVQRAVATERQHDEALSQRDQARANVQLAEAEIRSARLNLSYTKVVAPGAGVTSLQSPPVGTLIQAQQTLLTTITQLDPAYVNFSFTDEDAQFFRALNRNREKPISQKDLTVELRIGNGTKYPHAGRIDTAAQRVDPQTGTIEARAIFPNPEGALLPGQFVRVVVRGVTLEDAIIIPRQAVSQGPQGASVFVVGSENKAEARPIRLGPEVPSGWVVSEGLKGGERVVVDGIMRVRPGATVRPVAMESDPKRADAPNSGGAAR